VAEALSSACGGKLGAGSTVTALSWTMRGSTANMRILARSRSRSPPWRSPPWRPPPSTRISTPSTIFFVNKNPQRILALCRSVNKSLASSAQSSSSHFGKCTTEKRAWGGGDGELV
jgi:hypothetical protein